MRIVEYYAENFKRLKVVEFTPKGRVTMFTGKNDQGKTSALDAIAFALGGKKWSPEMPTRKGAKSVKVRLDLGEIIVTRTATGLTVEPTKGNKAWDTPQAMLDSIFDELSFDPMTFTKLKPKEQAELLRKGVTLEVNLDELAALNAADYNARRDIQREADQLAAQASGIAVMGDEAPAKIDTAEIEARIAAANQKNRELAATIQKRAELTQAIESAERGIENNDRFIKDHAKQLEELRAALPRAVELQRRAKIAEEGINTARMELGDDADFQSVQVLLSTTQVRIHEQAARFLDEIENASASIEMTEKAIEAAEGVKPTYRQALEEAQQALESAPIAELIDTAALMDELRLANENNRSAAQWAYRQQLLDKRKEREAEARRLTRLMEERDETKRKAIANAKMPVEGLAFDDEGVYVEGVPITQLGEARQIKIGISIVLARNPKLRLIRIPHGEALDEETLAELAQMAEAHDFYIWMAKVDSSGKVGIYLEDGEVKAVNQ